ncbi:thiosulfate sulfurtransferase 16, chloroplastic [Vigna radiata var. radiata]|uniref:Thiosulfate sulfurtransferase 16, chloroplastic n=1 Tax=Vigna radiata var. radiata TaxID=3916 RepID=A0A1S3VMW4_VIGRR|nr:thiosulfate sulfurtransferase 16, chloroplastic [Vigna radiata var. radiata]
MTTTTTATTFDVSAACFRVPPSSSPRFSRNPCHTRFSVLNSLNPHRGRISVNVPPKFPNFRMEVALKGDLEAVVPTSVPVRVAYELLLAGHRYLDVRTPEEFDEGHVPGAINIPYMFRVGSGMTKNGNFITEVSSHFRKDDEIIVGCQLGKRSIMAASDLLAAGFTGLTDMAGGFAAWTQNGLPTER